MAVEPNSAIEVMETGHKARVNQEGCRYRPILFAIVCLDDPLLPVDKQFLVGTHCVRSMVSSKAERKLTGTILYLFCNCVYKLLK
jgi:hypothetical protein